MNFMLLVRSYHLRKIFDIFFKTNDIISLRNVFFIHKFTVFSSGKPSAAAPTPVTPFSTPNLAPAGSPQLPSFMTGASKLMPDVSCKKFFCPCPDKPVVFLSGIK